MTVTYLFVAVFLGMMVYICHYSATHKQELINNSYNGRQQMLTAKNVRGTIYADNGEILAQTVMDEDGKEKRNYPYGTFFPMQWVMRRMAGQEWRLWGTIISSIPIRPCLKRWQTIWRGKNIWATTCIRLWM